MLCHFLETNPDEHNMMDKNVIELGAGTGLVSIVSSLLGTETKHSIDLVFKKLFTTSAFCIYLFQRSAALSVQVLR